MRSRTMPKPSWNLEYLMWIFTRVSGLSLILLAIVGISAGLIMGARDTNGSGDFNALGIFPQSQSCPGQRDSGSISYGRMDSGRSCRSWLYFLQPHTDLTD